MAILVKAAHKNILTSKEIKPGSIVMYHYYEQFLLRQGIAQWSNHFELMARYFESFVQTLAEGEEERCLLQIFSFLKSY